MAKPILVLDLGSTSTRAFVISSTTFEILGSAKHEIKLIQTDHGTCEINPNDLFSNIIRILRDALKDAQIDAENILCLSMSVQRATFIVLDKVTGEPYHNLISWSDRRANDMVERINNGCGLKILSNLSAFAYCVTRRERFKQGSNLRLLNNFIAPRLSHLLQHNRKLKEAAKAGRAALCTVDTWLLNRLKNFNKFEKFDFITDITNASATGLYDPFNLNYVPINLKMFGIDKSMLPKIVDNSYDFGYTHKGIVGVPVRISTIIADQAASLIGNGCFRRMDAKITLGTGSFLNVNTGRKCTGSRSGAHPMIAWNLMTRRKQSSMVFYTERSFNDSSVIIRFASSIGLCSNVEELSDMALSVNDSDGVIFVPKFYSLAGFVGCKQSTTKSHFVRAILESIVFKVAHFYFLTKDEMNYHFDKIRIDGGISANNFICQSIADLINIPIERGVNCTDITSIGCAYLAAFNCGILEELESSGNFYKVEKTFYPNEVNRKELFLRYKKFEELNSHYE